MVMCPPGATGEAFHPTSNFLINVENRSSINSHCVSNYFQFLCDTSDTSLAGWHGTQLGNPLQTRHNLCLKRPYVVLQDLYLRFEAASGCNSTCCGQ